MGAFLLAGCSDEPSGPVKDDNDEFTDLGTRIERNNDFALELYRAVAGDTLDNFMISPHSTEVCFAMVYAGARGMTEIEIADVMNFHYPQENGFHPAMKALNDELCGRAGDWFEIQVANGCWIDNRYNVLQSFQDTLAIYYNAELDTVDFSGDPEGARTEINDWIYENTDHKIADAFPPESISPMTMMVLANTFSFFAKWLNCFDPAYTWDGTFHLLDGSTVTVPIMSGEGHFETFDGDGYSVIRLPYEGDLVSMLIMLPDEGNFESFEADLEGSFLISLYDSLENGYTCLSLPRWTITTELSLRGILQDMGMTTSFYPGTDFSGIDGTDDGQPWIDTVIHKTHMFVNEYGTGAWAATGMVLTVGIVPHFDAVRPFIFAIVDEPTGTIMFMGRVMEANDSFTPPF
jgi:serpin B